VPAKATPQERGGGCRMKTSKDERSAKKKIVIVKKMWGTHGKTCQNSRLTVFFGVNSGRSHGRKGKEGGRESEKT